MRRWKYPPLNTGGLLSATLALEAFWIAETYTDAPAGFQMLATGFGVLFALMSYWSFRKFGVLIR